MPAAHWCQARITVATVRWVTAATGSFGSSADWPGLVLASSQPRR